VPAFVVTVDTPLPPAVAWRRVTDWAAHGRFVPLTRVRPVGTPGEPGAGFVARTAIGPVGFDDPMEIVSWDPPRSCRVEKRGRVVRGWAELTVEPRGSGARVSWREDAVPAGLPHRLRPVADLVGRRLFGRVLRGLLADR
jgi:carbon monoxide dehydrogenase subunit G